MCEGVAAVCCGIHPSVCGPSVWHPLVCGASACGGVVPVCEGVAAVCCGIHPSVCGPSMCGGGGGLGHWG